MNKSGVYKDTKKDGTPNFRASITRRGKHISLGSYSSENEANRAYEYALLLLDSKLAIHDFDSSCPLIFEKYVVLINLRDNGIYFSTPIYLEKRGFLYYYSPEDIYKFDLDDLFYFSSHKIMKRGNHLFVSDYGAQTSVNEHFGIRPFCVEGRDYVFINGDKRDFRRENLKIINRYFGVIKKESKMKVTYKAYINIKGRFIIGTYDTEIQAAIAFNKAVDVVRSKGITKKYPQNYIEGISPREYASIYTELTISDKLYNI